ncbi:MAG: sugar ABC transporter permease [Spirochaetae bacterium HGW-Spirochaetae-7]|jgi:multiple sugar transport system permease protein|nr:MAG: sugar ABC transporter permease [Spirochaetae bacterium HGW-Spirochaetae-7]
MKSRQSMGRLERNRSKWGWLFVAPGLVFFSVFSFYPMLNAIWTSFFNKRLLSLKRPNFIGLQNYVRVLGSEDFWNSARATATFTVGVFVPLFIMSLLFAALITSMKRGKRLAQAALYSPAVLSSVVAALIWLLMLDPRGLANQFVNWISRTPGIDHRWLSDSVMVQVSTMIVYVWKYLGYFTILFVTGIGKIPDSVNEAAVMDGAGPIRCFFSITLPLLRPTTVLVSVMILIQCMKTFSTQYLFTQGGAPLGPINVITLNIYNTAMRDLNIGKASVMSTILFLFMMGLTWVQLRVSRRDEAEL